jgi:hypothetical protein
MQADKQELWGKPVVYVQDVKVSGNKATVRDCQDGTKAGQADARTHQLIPGTKGEPRVPIEAILVRGTDGRWRLTSVYYLDSPSCSRRTA